jgi:hypothetical protein
MQYCMDVIRVRLCKKYKRPTLFTIKRKEKVNSKYGLVRFITKLIKRKDESPVETKPIRQSERVVQYAKRVVQFIQIFRNKIDTPFKPNVKIT